MYLLGARPQNVGQEKTTLINHELFIYYGLFDDIQIMFVIDFKYLLKYYVYHGLIDKVSPLYIYIYISTKSFRFTYIDSV